MTSKWSQLACWRTVHKTLAIQILSCTFLFPEKILLCLLFSLAAHLPSSSRFFHFFIFFFYNLNRFVGWPCILHIFFYFHSFIHSFPLIIVYFCFLFYFGLVSFLPFSFSLSLSLLLPLALPRSISLIPTHRYATRTADTRLNVIIGHVFAVQNRKVAAAVTTAVRQAFAALPAGERVQANESPYVMVGGDAGIAADTKMFDALYLGYVRVSKQEGAKMIKKAAEVNAASREAMAKMRQSKGARKSSLLQGGGAATRHGTAVEEDPITIIITPRSLRIIDRLAGETVFKFLLPNITFATSSKGSKHDTFGCVVHNEQLGITNCHLFYTTPGAGAGLGQAVASAISEYQRRFGGISMSGNPWEVSNYFI